MVEDRSIKISSQNVMNLASIMSDLQEEIKDKRLRGKINLIKGVLFGNVEIVQEGFMFRFKNKNPNSRFCDDCGLLRVSEYRECECC